MAAAGLRILVIEDHPALGRFVAAALAGAGWAVLGPLGDHASAMEAARHEPVDVAVTDRLVQGNETFAIADALAERGVRCVIMSGYPRSTLPERFQDLPFLEKPFTMDALIEAVRAAAIGPG